MGLGGIGDMEELKFPQITPEQKRSLNHIHDRMGSPGTFIFKLDGKLVDILLQAAIEELNENVKI